MSCRTKSTVHYKLKKYEDAVNLGGLGGKRSASHCIYYRSVKKLSLKNRKTLAANIAAVIKAVITLDVGPLKVHNPLNMTGLYQVKCLNFAKENFNKSPKF